MAEYKSELLRYHRPGVICTFLVHTAGVTAPGRIYRRVDLILVFVITAGNISHKFLVNTAGVTVPGRI